MSETIVQYADMPRGVGTSRDEAATRSANTIIAAERASSPEITVVVTRVFEKMDQVVGALIGSLGFRSILARAVDLTARQGARLTSPKLSYAALHPEEYVFVSKQKGLKRREDAQRHTLVDVSRDLPLFRYLMDALPDAEPWPFARVEHLGRFLGVVVISVGHPEAGHAQPVRESW